MINTQARNNQRDLNLQNGFWLEDDMLKLDRLKQETENDNDRHQLYPTYEQLQSKFLVSVANP